MLFWYNESDGWLPIDPDISAPPELEEGFEKVREQFDAIWGEETEAAMTALTKATRRALDRLAAES